MSDKNLMDVIEDMLQEGINDHVNKITQDNVKDGKNFNPDGPSADTQGVEGKTSGQALDAGGDKDVGGKKGHNPSDASPDTQGVLGKETGQALDAGGDTDVGGSKGDNPSDASADTQGILGKTSGQALDAGGDKDVGKLKEETDEDEDEDDDDKDEMKEESESIEEKDSNHFEKDNRGDDSKKVLGKHEGQALDAGGDKDVGKLKEEEEVEEALTASQRRDIEDHQAKKAAERQAAKEPSNVTSKGGSYGNKSMEEEAEVVEEDDVPGSDEATYKPKPAKTGDTQGVLGKTTGQALDAGGDKDVGKLKESTYELDVSHDGHDDFHKKAKAAGIKSKTVNHNGPGGGNPVVHISHHDSKHVHSFVKKHYDDQMSHDELVDHHKLHEDADIEFEEIFFLEGHEEALTEDQLAEMLVDGEEIEFFQLEEGSADEFKAMLSKADKDTSHVKKNHKRLASKATRDHYKTGQFSQSKFDKHRASRPERKGKTFDPTATAKAKSDAKNLEKAKVSADASKGKKTTVAPQKDPKKQTAREEVEMTQDQIISEEHKEKAKVIFEATVAEKVAMIKEEMEAEKEAAIEEAKKALDEKVSGLVAEAVQEWLKENALEVKYSLRTEIAENFIRGLKGLFEDSYIEIPEDEVSVVDELTEAVEEQREEIKALTEELNESRAFILETRKADVIKTVSEDLTQTQAIRLEKLSEGLEAADIEEFRGKVESLKESFFDPTAEQPLIGSLTEEVLTGDEYIPEDVDSPVAQYAAFLGRTVLK